MKANQELFNMQMPHDLKVVLQKESDRTGNSVAALVRTAVIEKYREEK